MVGQETAVEGTTLDADKALAPPPEISSRAQPHVDEGTLILRSRAGDRAAFEALYLRHRAAVAQVCRRWLRDAQLAEDAVQETFLRAWLAMPRYATGDFPAWLRTIARNHCADVQRSLRRRPAEATAADRMADLPATTTAADLEVVERTSVDALLSRLAPRDAALLREHHMLGLPLQVLATRWNLTRGATEVAVHRARQRARRVAERMDLRGLVPVDGFRRLLAWTERFIGDVGGASSGAVVLCHLAVVAAAVAGSALGWSTDDKARSPQARSSTAVLATLAAQSGPAATTGPATSSERPALSRDADAHGRVDDATRKGTPPKSPKRLATFDPVPVPVAGGSLRPGPEAHWEERHRFGVRNPTTGGNVVSKTTHEHDHEASRTASDHACTVADAAEPTTLTYCD